MAHPRNDDALMEEVVSQLHDVDDRRDAAEMRVEELVRDAEFEGEGEEAHRPRASRLVIAGIVAAAAAVLWVLARLIPS